MQDLSGLHTLVINSLEEQIAAIDQAGTIVDVNSAWTNFGVENGLSTKYACVGCNYLKVLSASVASGDSLAGEAEQGISDVVNGKRASFYLEYPCHSPDRKRWFIMRVTRLKDDSRSLFVIPTTISRCANWPKNGPNTWPCTIRLPDWRIAGISTCFQVEKCEGVSATDRRSV